MSEQIVCNSCKKRITNKAGTTMFPCPKCAGEEIVRCEHCREIVSRYACSKCGFIGPN
ncbi:RNA-binding protein [Candidatus Woesearchaeota archaeon]|nr:RNA-binding protein [Candidatus Woesearchaeota archaeon]MBI2130957.1 RNA-binding protein [Candidatus Woesearchaeota archaeon]MBI2661028.1 RNA-binding protein [Candidatus Woesearchaeota archaeon]